jgi:transposase
MTTHITHTPATSSTQAEQDAPRHESIKLGIDAHLENYRVVRMIEQMPQPAQRFDSLETLLRFVAKQQKLARKVHTCYEAGPLGYVLHRRLITMGVHNVVVVPVNLDERNKGVKTDSRDALALCTRLGRYVAGDKAVFSIVAVPTEAEEQARTVGRERSTFSKERRRAVTHVTLTCLYYGVRLPKDWWKAACRREAMLAALPEHLRTLVSSWLEVIVMLEKKLREIEAHIEKSVGDEALPRYLGALTASLLDREVRDWNRFNNRRQIASFTGLCPRVDSSGGRHFQGSVSKHGNPRLRTMLVELAWRLVLRQPTYKAVARWLPKFATGTASLRKKIVVAVARQFCVDWWRVRTGRCTAESLGLVITAV